MKRLFVIVVATICVAYKDSVGAGILTAAAMAQILYIFEIIEWGVKNDPKWPIPPHL